MEPECRDHTHPAKPRPKLEEVAGHHSKCFFLHIVMLYDSDNDAFQEMAIVFYVNKCHIVGALNDMALPIFECSL